MGSDGFYSPTMEFDRKEDCVVCGQAAEARSVKILASSTLSDLIDELKQNQSFQLKKPSITSGTSSLYLTAPPPLEKATRANLSKSLTELGLETGCIVGVTDPVLFQPMNIKLELL